MCSVSAVLGQFTGPTYDPQRFYNPLPVQQWPLDQSKMLLEVIAKLDALDKKVGAKDCHEPTKDAFLKSLETRIAELEKRP